MSTDNGWKDLTAEDCKKRADHYDNTYRIGEVLMHCWTYSGTGAKWTHWNETLPDSVIADLAARGFSVTNDSTGHTISWS